MLIAKTSIEEHISTWFCSEEKGKQWRGKRVVEKT